MTQRQAPHRMEQMIQVRINDTRYVWYLQWIPFFRIPVLAAGMVIAMLVITPERKGSGNSGHAGGNGDGDSSGA